MARWRGSASTSTSGTSIPWSAACCAIWAPMVPAPTTSRRPWSPRSRRDRVIRSAFIRPPDRHTGGAVGQLLRGLGVSHDRREIALQLQPAEHDPLGGVELLLRHLLPARIRAGDHEFGLLSVLASADAHVARLAVPEIEEDAAILREVLVGLGEHHQPDRALPARRSLLVDGRLVDLSLEGFGPLRAVSVDDVRVCH